MHFARHQKCEADERKVAADLEAKLNLWSGVMLVTFLAFGISLLALFNASFRHSGAVFVSPVSAVCYAFARFRHIRLSAEKNIALARAKVHAHHQLRLLGKYKDLPQLAIPLTVDVRAFAQDIDLVGPASLLLRIGTLHTARGIETALTWLTKPALAWETLRSRQDAVREIGTNTEFRRDLEVAVLARDLEHLDDRPLLEFVSAQRLPLARFQALCALLPVATGALYLAFRYAHFAPIFVVPLIAQFALTWRYQTHIAAQFARLEAQRGALDAWADWLRVASTWKPTTPYAKSRCAALLRGDKAQSVAETQLARLSFWGGLLGLRHQGIFHLLLNPLLLWDLNCIVRLEANAGSEGDWEALFSSVGELEALAALSVLSEDPDANFPSLESTPQILGSNVGHPLLGHKARVKNDLPSLHASSLVIVTGSNMAGKSTLLRSLGLNAALALAGGPVIADAFSIGPMRIRASMRAFDSLDLGSSYFHAELEKLKSVIAEAEQEPPIFFLLDELLRGTNAEARRIGAEAVIEHLRSRKGFGYIATHDMGLTELANESDIVNVHFTDVIVDGEMAFDYKLRPGPVLKSNALELLAMAGIDVPREKLGRTS